MSWQITTYVSPLYAGQNKDVN